MPIPRSLPLLGRCRLDARQEIVERPVRNHVATRGTFEGDVLFDHEPLASPAGLFDKAQVAEIKRRAEAPIAVLEPGLKLGRVGAPGERPPSERRIPGPPYPSVPEAEGKPRLDGVGRAPRRRS